MIKLIYAKNLNNTIGINNTLPWTIKEDLQRFKELTTDHTVVMGRKTFESLPSALQPLPNRDSIVLADENWTHPKYANITHVSSLSSLYDHINRYTLEQDKQIFIIGGSSLFNLFLPVAQVIYETLVFDNTKGDVIISKINYEDYQLKSSSPIYTAKHSLTLYQFNTYERKT